MHATITCNHEARHVLVRLIGDHGPALAADARRLEGLLRDYCPRQRKEIFAIVQAQKEGIPVEIQSLSGSVPSRVLVGRLSQQLQTRVGLSPEIATWATAAWACALGILSEEELAFPPQVEPAAETVRAAPVATDVSPAAEAEVNPRAVAQDLISQCEKSLRQALAFGDARECLQQAEEALRLLQATRLAGDDGDKARALIASAESMVTRIAWKLAEHERKARRFDRLLVYLDRILAIAPDHAAAKGLRETVLAERRQLSESAAKNWREGKLNAAVSQLKHLAEAFAGDGAIAEEYRAKEAALKRLQDLLRREIPELKQQNKFHALTAKLDEAESLAPIPGITEYRALIASRQAAAERHVEAARSALGVSNYQAAKTSVEQALAVATDYPAALELREVVDTRAAQSSGNATAIRDLIRAGCLAAALRQINEWAADEPEQPALISLRKQWEEATKAMTSYWRFVASALGGLLLWWLSGWLAAHAEESIRTAWPQGVDQALGTGPSQSLQRILVQLLFASFLLGIGTTALVGRKGMANVAVLVGIAVAGVVVVAGAYKFSQNSSTTSTLASCIAVGLAYGSFIAAAIHGVGQRDGLAILYPVAGAILVILSFGWLFPQYLPQYPPTLGRITFAALHFATVLAVLGVVRSGWRFALLPIGLLLGYALANAMQAADWSPWLISLTIGSALALAVLPLNTACATTKGVVGLLLVAFAVVVVCDAAMDSKTVSNAVLLMTIWCAAWFFLALARHDRNGLELLGAGGRYLIDFLRDRQVPYES